MTVSELIEQLNKYPPEQEVQMEVEEYIMGIDYVKEENKQVKGPKGGRNDNGEKVVILY